MKRRSLHRRYGHSGPRKFVEYFIYVDGKRLETGPHPGVARGPTWFRSRKAAIETAKSLRAAGHTVKVERRTHSAVEGYKRMNVRVK